MARPSSIRVAAIQTGSQYWDKEGNLQRVLPLIEEAAKKGAQLVLLPEMFVGYAYSSSLLWKNAEVLSDSPTLKFLSVHAKRLKIHLGGSFLEASGEHFFNTFVLVGARFLL